MTFIAISKIVVNSNAADKLEESFRNRSKKVDSFDGFIGVSFLRKKKPNNNFIGIFHFRESKPLGERPTIE